MALSNLFYSFLDSITPFQAAFATSLLLFYLVYLFLKDNALPPGPIGLPYIGYWPFLRVEACHEQLKEMVGVYGDVLSLRVFGQLFVQLGSIKAVKEAHIAKGDCFDGRPSGYSILTELFRDGLAITNGEPWKVQRKFFLQKFKQYGMSGVKENTSNALQDALTEIVEELHDSKGQPIAITSMTTNKCLAMVRSILFNDQGISMEEMTELKMEFEKVMTAFRADVFLLCGSFVKYFIYPFKPETRRMRSIQNRIDSILMEVVRRHKTAADETQSDDVVDCFFREKEERQKRGDPTAKYFTDTALVSSLSQFVTDGVLTVGLFIGVFLLRLVEFPEEQRKIYEEILDVVGQERLPTMEDRNKLPYTNAFIYEVMRLSDFFPFFTSMECSRDTEVLGINIPKGAITVINLYAAHRDPQTYEDPETFNPSRYLSTSKTKAELPILFGVGKRSCIGEAFTMIQTFLFLTTIVKIFRLEVPESEKGASIKLYNPQGVRICAIPRSQP